MEETEEKEAKTEAETEEKVALRETKDRHFTPNRDDQPRLLSFTYASLSYVFFFFFFFFQHSQRPKD